MGERFDPSRGVEELPKPPRLAVPECPDVDERDVEELSGLLRHTPVTPEHDDLVAGVEKLIGYRGELRPPVAVERVEHVRPDLGKTPIRPSMLETLCLLPLDRIVHVRDDGVQVAPGEGIVRAADDGHVHGDQRS